MSAAERNKGARGERAVVAWLRENGFPDARRYLAGDGRQPGDIDGVLGACIDVKMQERLCIPEWLRQVEDEAQGKRTPILAVWRRGLSDPGRWWAISRLEYVAPLFREDVA